MAEEQKPDYRAELKAVLDDFDQAAEKGGEAIKELREGVTRLARLVQTGLAGTQFEKQADLLALELARAGVTTETLHNAPLKVRRTGGADIYKVIGVLEKKAAEEAEAQPQAEAVEAPTERHPEFLPEQAARPAVEPKPGRK